MVRTKSTMQDLGSKAPNFTLANTNPNWELTVVSLSDFADKKGVLVAFICNHCPYVIHILDEFITFSSQYISKEIAIIAVSSNDVENYPEDSPQKMAELATKNKFSFPYLYDEDQEVARAYKAACTPDFFLYDKDMRLVYRGQFDNSRPNNQKPTTGSDLREAADALLEHNVISQNQIPSIGCNIKWKPNKEPDYFPDP